MSHSWVLHLFQRTHVLRLLVKPFKLILTRMSFWRLEWRLPQPFRYQASARIGKYVDYVWFLFLALLILWSLCCIYDFVHYELSWHDVLTAVLATCATMARVIIRMCLATLFWVPISIWIGLRPQIADFVQPIAQFLAAFPVNIIFPIAVIFVLHFHLDPNIWLSPLIIFGTQWYIVFNVIAGASAFPSDLREVVANLHIRGMDWWLIVILPAIFPYYVTGALTASGGSWNAPIVAEYVNGVMIGSQPMALALILRKQLRRVIIPKLFWVWL